jgi:hypothetical protein
MTNMLKVFPRRAMCSKVRSWHCSRNSMNITYLHQDLYLTPHPATSETPYQSDKTSNDLQPLKDL